MDTDGQTNKLNGNISNLFSFLHKGKHNKKDLRLYNNSSNLKIGVESFPKVIHKKPLHNASGNIQRTSIIAVSITPNHIDVFFRGRNLSYEI
jgi:hypothetical protein